MRFCYRRTLLKEMVSAFYLLKTYPRLDADNLHQQYPKQDLCVVKVKFTDSDLIGSWTLSKEAVSTFCLKTYPRDADSSLY